MPIYTGGGDRGKTSLLSGERVAKHHHQVEALGDMDELATMLGTVDAAFPDGNKILSEEIRSIQALLLQAGAWLAASPGSGIHKQLDPIKKKHIRFLEKAIDRMTQTLPPLTRFILPGGLMPAPWAHLARTVCRRTERHVTLLAPLYEDSGYLNDFRVLLALLNRLSDYLFTLARFINHSQGGEDVVWPQ